MCAGPSNAPGGITFGMKYLNDVFISEDMETTIVGIGITWGDMYKVLDQINRAVEGGRNTVVGIGGL
jgi:hypothetical protein